MNEVFIDDIYNDPTVAFKHVRSFETKDGRNVESREREEGLLSPGELNEAAEASLKGEATPKRVLFIDFKTKRKVPENEDYSFQNFFNLGLHRMEGYLEDYEVPVQLLRYDELAEMDEEERNKVLDEADIIGVSNMTNQVEDAYALCVEIKAKYGDTKTTIGGSEHYLGYEEILADQEQTGIDLCCIGQGELPMLALALGQPVDKIGSLVHRHENEDGSITITRNKRFKRLLDMAPENQQEQMDILNERPASSFSLEEVQSPPPFNELNGLPEGMEWDATFATQFGTGCIHQCSFCPSERHDGKGYNAIAQVAATEVRNFKDQFPEMKNVFVTLADTMINSSEKHLNTVIDTMEQINNEPGPKISWFAYLSVPPIKEGEDEATWLEKWDGLIARMADAGCIMAAVGLEEIIYDRNATHKKGEALDQSAAFIDLVGNHMLARSLLILGAPDHFLIDKEKTMKSEEDLEKYPDDRSLIKGEILEFMKKHPQALYRMNPWTLVYGTGIYDEYKDTLAEDVSNPAELKHLDHLHSVLDPKKMYDRLGEERGEAVPEDDRWVKDREDWFVLMEEIMEEYLACPEYAAMLKSLENQSETPRGRLLYEIALKFKQNASGQIVRNRQARENQENIA